MNVEDELARLREATAKGDTGTQMDVIARLRSEGDETTRAAVERALNSADGGR